MIMAPNLYVYSTTPPTPAEHLHLRTISGLSPPPASPAQLTHALQNSVFTVVARLSDNSAVGMARLIGDGALFLQLVDVSVDPAHQRQGIGRAMLQMVERWIDANAPQAYVSLLADPPGVTLYQSAGFVMSAGIAMRRSTWGR